MTTSTCTVQRPPKTDLFVCFLEFIVPLENFSLIWRRHHCRWRAANFDLCSNLWPLSSEGSLTRHTYCDTGLPFIMVISEDPWHSHLLPSVWQWSCHYLFLRLRSVATGDRTPISRMRGERSSSTPPRRSQNRQKTTIINKQCWGSYSFLLKQRKRLCLILKKM